MRVKTTYIWVTTSFVGFHRWKDAPSEVEFLRHFHRHVFHVKLFVPVSHDNRDVEFLQLKDRLDAYLVLTFGGEGFEHSCEQIASMILDVYPHATRCEVSEDGENGATVILSERRDN